jgi:hypothetical protein
MEHDYLKAIKVSNSLDMPFMMSLHRRNKGTGEAIIQMAVPGAWVDSEGEKHPSKACWLAPPGSEIVLPLGDERTALHVEAPDGVEIKFYWKDDVIDFDALTYGIVRY